MFRILIRSFRKSWRLHHISRVLGEPISISVQDLFRQAPARRDAEEALYDLVENDPCLKHVLACYDGNREALRELYRWGLGAGLAVWVKGHWVAASALAFGPTLEFLLSRTPDDNIDDIADKLIKYFLWQKVSRDFFVAH